MPPYIDLGKLLLNSSLVILWHPVSFQSMCAIIFSLNFNLIAVSSKIVRIDVWSLRIPMFTNLQPLTQWKNGREQIKLSSICVYLVELKDL